MQQCANNMATNQKGNKMLKATYNRAYKGYFCTLVGIPEGPPFFSLQLPKILTSKTFSKNKKQL